MLGRPRALRPSCAGPTSRRAASADERVRALADAAALAEPLTDWLLAAACRQAARWRAGGLPALHVAVPLLSRRQLVWGDLARRLERHLASAGMAPAELELEIDESLLLDQRDAPGGPLAAARELGVRLAVAGYGAGPTSLGALRDLPLTTVKLARDLLAGVPDDEVRTAVTSGIVRLATRSRPAGRGRRRRDPSPAPAPAAARLRRRPGSDLLPAAAGRRLLRLAAAGRTTRLTATTVLSALRRQATGLEQLPREPRHWAPDAVATRLRPSCLAS